ncbi:MAG: D-isomer specific 2-hydroxyacid dehydrogenase, NAD-binding protein, partial [Parcubacteria group bacterium GW2011_GWB1_41_5]
ERLKEIPDIDILSSFIYSVIDKKILNFLKFLKFIATRSTGFDHLDLKTCKDKNIFVSNVPSYGENTVAEHTFALMLALAHRIPEADRFTKAGRFKGWEPLLFLGTDLSKKTLGIVGLGRIGSRVAYHAVKGFEMKVLYYDIKQNQEFEGEFGAIYKSDLNDLLGEADFVSLHVPLLESTRHLINEARLKIMKPTAYLINTSRGAVIDEKALTMALKNKIIRGAALDVFENEPKLTPGLTKLDNVILTPHIASATEETQNIIEALEGRIPPNLVKV